MTDRIRHLTVILDADYRDDDVVPILEAIRMVRGVDHVEEHVVEAQDLITHRTVRSELERDLHKAIDNVFGKNFERSLAERMDRT